MKTDSMQANNYAVHVLHDAQSCSSLIKPISICSVKTRFNCFEVSWTIFFQFYNEFIHQYFGSYVHIGKQQKRQS